MIYQGSPDIGLSPLARGTPDQPEQQCVLNRFIPAGAGNTAGRSPRGVTPAVYPRWRGEHGLVGLTFRTDSGLSPLARGTLD